MVTTHHGHHGQPVQKPAILEYKIELETVPTLHRGMVGMIVKDWEKHTKQGNAGLDFVEVCTDYCVQNSWCECFSILHFHNTLNLWCFLLLWKISCSLVNGTLTEWREWSGCTVSCGGGTTYRIRKCIYHKRVPPELEIYCNNASLYESKTCNTHFCSGKYDDVLFALLAYFFMKREFVWFYEWHKTGSTCQAKNWTWSAITDI